MSSDEIVGSWISIGEEVRLLNDGTIEVINLKLEKQISKTTISDVYLVKEIFYYLDGSVNYGPTSYLINTDNKKEFICADEYPTGTGVDKYVIGNQQIKYSYNVDGISDGTKWKSLVGEFILKKDSKPLYKSVSTTKANIKLKDGSIITATGTASATGHSAYEAELASKDLSIHNALEVANAVNKKDVVNITTDTHTDSVVTNL
jgi:hypothetical protein